MTRDSHYVDILTSPVKKTKSINWLSQDSWVTILKKDGSIFIEEHT